MHSSGNGWRNTRRNERSAQTDVIEIWCYIARDNVEAADRVRQAIREAFDFVAAHPLLGHPRLKLPGKIARFWVVPQFRNYSVVYRPDTKPVQILAVLHGKLEGRRLLKKRI